MCKGTFNKWLCGCETLASASLEHYWQYPMCASITRRRYVDKRVHCPTHALTSRLRERGLVPHGMIDRHVAFDFHKGEFDHNINPVSGSYALLKERRAGPLNTLPAPGRTSTLAERLARESRAPGNIAPGGMFKAGRQDVSGGRQRQQTLPSLATVLQQSADQESTMLRKQRQGDSATVALLKNAVDPERQNSEQAKMQEHNDNRQRTSSSQQQWHR